MVAIQLAGKAVPVSSLKPDPANLRLHGPESIAAIEASLARFGQQKPIVVDKNGVVIAGHGMLEAAKCLGWKTIHAVTSDLKGVDRVAYGIADNRTAEKSSWDEEALARILAEMPADALKATGFDKDDIDELNPGALPDDVPPDPPRKPVARLGDLWHLGDHRILCGDSTKRDDFARLLGGVTPVLCATDPPYLVDYTGKRPGKTGKDWTGVYREIDIPDAEQFYRGVFGCLLEVLAPGSAIYVWHAHRWTGLLQRLWAEFDILDHQMIVWVKPAMVFTRALWHFRHETCMLGWKRGKIPHCHRGLEDDTVWEEAGGTKNLEDLSKEQLIAMLKRASDTWELDWEGKARPVGIDHPTPKPLEVFAKPMRKHTKVGDACLEPFSGSGSQLIAAERLQRRCFAMELQPAFVDVAIKRWQAITGKEAKLEGKATWTHTAKARRVRVDA